MIVVIDTNVLLSSLAHPSKKRPIFDGLIEGKYTLAVSNEIIEEYAEIIAQKTSIEVSENVIQFILGLANIQKTDIYFKWNFIHKDPDDNKFVDCAISAGVKYVVSDDKHFRILKEINFPYVEIITADEFLEELKEL